MMRTFLTLVGALCLALCLVSVPAYAIIIGGHSGHGWPNEAVDCFQGSWSRMFNIGGHPICTAPGTVLVIPLHITESGTWRIVVRASGNGSEATICTAIVNDLNNGGFGFATDATTPGSSAIEPLDVGVVTLPLAGTLSVECRVPVGGSVQSVSWVP